ncbi:hypothetical protein L4W01_005761 [Pseudomonas aeruginosa]|uniref:hypothetical protein n=1 Tax=Pseudomonas aeruginosa TaxID=287 RepID=UPI001AE0C898|nr:hypothetical protein [Pseudomonas aeruginosa]EKU9565756.1 hypothetical protein [Pseudomonas aeruginosa]MDF1652958.1 hypothetical protein [Pseudomonas aeruginosa]HCF4511739.1 hypothetical protein [Pseudomonas aeruginosa]
MLDSRVESALCGKYPADLVAVLLNSYKEVVVNYRLERWKPSELDAGHFVEAVRRMLEFELLGTYTPIGVGLGSFNQSVLNKFESAVGDEAFRILMPRVLYAIYCVRNKRGVGHVASVSPNKMDATYIYSSVKWVLAELVRMCSALSPEEADDLVSLIVERDVDVIWDDGESFVFLNGKLKAEQKVLVCLCRKDRQTSDALRKLISYKNKSEFNKILLKLKSAAKIDILESGLCKISPLGLIEAERIIMN